jgi:hypothetical protein
MWFVRYKKSKLGNSIGIYYTSKGMNSPITGLYLIDKIDRQNMFSKYAEER